MLCLYEIKCDVNVFRHKSNSINIVGNRLPDIKAIILINEQDIRSYAINKA